MRTKFFTLTPILVTVLFLLGLSVFAQSTFSPVDKEQIAENLNALVQAVNMGDIQKISALVTPDNQILQSDIQKQIQGGVTYQLEYAPLDDNIEMRDTGQVRINATFAASGVGWNISGLSTYFIFQKQNDKWFIFDTDFHKKLGADYTLRVLMKVFIFTGPVLLLFFAFWLWMLIDCIKREFDDKALWVIILIFLSFLGSVLYYFIVKRKNIMRKPLEYKMQG